MKEAKCPRCGAGMNNIICHNYYGCLYECSRCGAEVIMSRQQHLQRIYTGEVVGASFYDDETGLMRKTPRLYVDLDDDVPVGHYRVYIVEFTEDEEGNTND